MLAFISSCRAPGGRILSSVPQSRFRAARKRRSCARRAPRARRTSSSWHAARCGDAACVFLFRPAPPPRGGGSRAGKTRARKPSMWYRHTALRAGEAGANSAPCDVPVWCSSNHNSCPSPTGAAPRPAWGGGCRSWGRPAARPQHPKCRRRKPVARRVRCRRGARPEGGRSNLSSLEAGVRGQNPTRTYETEH